MIDIILKYFPEITELQKQQFAALYDLYKTANEKVNVISRKDIDQLYERHILHSLAIAKFVQFIPHTKVLDLGTGGGFPAAGRGAAGIGRGWQGPQSQSWCQALILKNM